MMPDLQHDNLSQERSLPSSLGPELEPGKLIEPDDPEDLSGQKALNPCSYSGSWSSSLPPDFRLRFNG